MELKDYSFVPHNDITIEDIQTYEQHKNLIAQRKYGDASNLVKDGKGFTASLFNEIQNKIRTIQLYLLNAYVAKPEEYYNDTEPDTAFMEENGYSFWIKPF